jgi:hypothetical protein
LDDAPVTAAAAAAARALLLKKLDMLKTLAQIVKAVHRWARCRCVEGSGRGGTRILFVEAI